MNFLKYLTVGYYFGNNQDSLQEVDEESLSAYSEFLDKIEEQSTMSSTFSQNDKKQILKLVCSYHSFQNTSESEITPKLDDTKKRLLQFMDKIKCKLDLAFLLEQYEYTSSKKQLLNKPFNDCLMHQGDNRGLCVTHINASSLYGLNQFQCAQRFTESLKSLVQERVELNDYEILLHFIDFYFDLILDLLYRRIPLTALLLQVQSQCTAECLKLLNVSNILTLVFERLVLLEKMNLGLILSSSYHPIPVFYKLRNSLENDCYRYNMIPAFYPLIDSLQKHIVLNISTSSIQKKQREEFFNYLLGNKDMVPDLKEGFNSSGTIHLYSQFPNSKLNQFMLFDNCRVDLFCSEFQNIFKKLISCSSVLLIHLNIEKDFNQLGTFTSSIEVDNVFKLIDNKRFILLIIHGVTAKRQVQIELSLRAFLTKYEFNHQIKIMQEDNAEFQYDQMFVQLKTDIFERKKEVYYSEMLEEVLSCYMKSCNSDNSDSEVIAYKQTIEQEIQKQLRKKSLSESEPFKLIPYMFQCSNSYSEYFYNSKLFNNESVESQDQRNKTYESLIVLSNTLKSIQELNEITKYFFKEITQNSYIKQAVISKILSEWKKPLVEENILLLDVVNETIRNLEKNLNASQQVWNIDDPQNQELEKAYNKRNQLIILQDNYDISIESFIREVSLFDENKRQSHIELNRDDSSFRRNTQQYYDYAFRTGIPIQFIDKTRRFGSALLEELFKDIDCQLRLQDFKIVSVVGPQSSAKSTLMNYLFRCCFETSSARCTKGMYFTAISFQGMNLLVIDTEGLLSNVFRDQSFDNSVMALLFLISHVIIFNIKDEANSKMKDLMNITEEVMKLFTDSIVDGSQPPEIYIALRDYFDRNDIESKKKQIINEMIQANGIFESSNLSQQNKKLIRLNPDNIFIFPSAFSELNCYQSRFKHINTGFGEDVLQLRQSIALKLSAVSGYHLIQDFYQRADNIWNRLMCHGHELLKSVTVQEFNAKRRLESLAIQYQIEINKDHIQKIEQKESELKSGLNLHSKDESVLNRIKEEYRNYVITENLQMNEELELKLQEEYSKKDKQINSLSPRDFFFILSKIQHRNRVNLNHRQSIFEQRIQDLYFNSQIRLLEEEFSRHIQQQINEGVYFEESQQQLMKLMESMKKDQCYKIEQLQKRFNTVDELMRQQLEQLKNEYISQFDPNHQSLILEISISQIEKFDGKKVKTQLTTDVDVVKRYLKDTHRLDQNRKKNLIQYLNQYFSEIKSKKCIHFDDNQDTVIQIFRLTINNFKIFFDSIPNEDHEFVNCTNIQKDTFSFLYFKVGEQQKKKQKQMQERRMEKYQGMVNQRMDYIKKVSTSSNNWVELGKKAMESIQARIIKCSINKYLAEIETKISQEVEDLTSNYTKAIDTAFQSTYDPISQMIHIDNFLKYTININRYIDEMKRDQIKIKADNLIADKTTQFNLGLDNVISSLNLILLEFSKMPTFDFTELIEKLNTVKLGSDCTLSLGEDIIIENMQNIPKFIEEEVQIESEVEEEIEEDEEDEEEEEKEEKENQEEEEESKEENDEVGQKKEKNEEQQNEHKQKSEMNTSNESKPLIQQAENNISLDKQELSIQEESTQKIIVEDNQEKPEELESRKNNLDEGLKSDEIRQEDRNNKDIISEIKTDNQFQKQNELLKESSLIQSNVSSDKHNERQNGNEDIQKEINLEEHQQNNDEIEQQISNQLLIVVEQGEQGNEQQLDQKLNEQQTNHLLNQEQINHLPNENQKDEQILSQDQDKLSYQVGSSQDIKDSKSSASVKEFNDPNLQVSEEQIGAASDLKENKSSGEEVNDSSLLVPELQNISGNNDEQNLKQGRAREDRKRQIQKRIKVRTEIRQIPVGNLYIQGMKKIYDEINPENSTKAIEQFRSDLNSEFEQVLKLHHKKMIGCQERCPFCGQKCHLELDHQGDHSVMDCHLIIGMHGYSKGKSYVDKFCFETIDQPFMINFITFTNMKEACQKLYPKWISCFEQEKMNTFDQEFTLIIKKGYTLTAKWLKNYHNKQRKRNLEANLPEEFIALVQNQEEIEETYKVQWKYPQDDDKNSESDSESEEGGKVFRVEIEFFRFLSFLRLLTELGDN